MSGMTNRDVVDALIANNAREVMRENPSKTAIVTDWDGDICVVHNPTRLFDHPEDTRHVEMYPPLHGVTYWIFPDGDLPPEIQAIQDQTVTIRTA